MVARGSRPFSRAARLLLAEIDLWTPTQHPREAACGARRAVDWGRARMDLTGITAAGVDEIHWRKGRFLTLVYQINEGMKRLLFVAENREKTSLRKFFLWLGAERSAQIRFICSDMW